jgi:hypothetical protein
LIEEAASNVLHLLNFILGSLCSGQNDRELLALVGSIEGVRAGVLGVEAAK